MTRTGELTINGTDAWTAYGVFLETSAMSTLLTPPPVKTYIESVSRRQHGKRITIDDADTGQYLDERDITLTVCLVADSREEFLTKYKAFCAVLQGGKLNLKTAYSDDTYKCVYLSCQQLTYRSRIGKFILKLNEPNPNDRS